MDANNNKENEYIMVKYISSIEAYKPYNDKYLVIKKINEEIKDFAMRYGANCPELGHNIIINLYTFPTYIKVVLSLYKDNIYMDITKKLTITNNNDDLLIEVLKYLTDENNNNSIVRKLNELTFRYTNEYENSNNRYKQYIVKIIENTAVNNHKISFGENEYHKYSITFVDYDNNY